MRSVVEILPLAFVSQAHSWGRAKTRTHKADEQGPLDKSFGKLAERTLEVWPLHHIDLETTTLAKVCFGHSHGTARTRPRFSVARGQAAMCQISFCSQRSTLPVVSARAEVSPATARVLTVGVTGASGSGKSTLAKTLVTTLEQEGWIAVVLDEPPYRKYRGKLDFDLFCSQGCQPDIENPECVNLAQLEADLEATRNQTFQADVPVVVVVEHFSLLALSNAALTSFDLVLFLEADKETCLARRANRPGPEKEQAAFPMYFEKCVWPSYLRNAKAQADALDSVNSVVGREMPLIRKLDASKPIEEILAAAKGIVLTARERSAPQ